MDGFKGSEGLKAMSNMISVDTMTHLHDFDKYLS